MLPTVLDLFGGKPFIVVQGNGMAPASLAPPCLLPIPMKKRSIPDELHGMV